MRKLLAIGAAALVLAQAGPALAFGGKGERKICKSSTDTGTRMTDRTCLTAAQWRALAKRSSKENENADAEGVHTLRSAAEIPLPPNGEGGTLPSPGQPR